MSGGSAEKIIQGEHKIFIFSNIDVWCPFVFHSSSLIVHKVAFFLCELAESQELLPLLLEILSKLNLGTNALDVYCGAFLSFWEISNEWC